MATNTSKGITYPTSGDSITPLETVFATLANTTDTALGAINAGTDITAGTLPITRGGTGAATAATARAALNVPSIDEAAYRNGKNVILNGAFDFWQRGTAISSAITTYSGYAADRFVFTGSTGFTQQRGTFSPGSSPVAGYEGKYYYNLTITSNNQNSEFLQRIEDVRTLAGQRVTLSFWARSTAGAQVCNSGLYQYFGTGGSPSATVAATSVAGQTYTWTANSTWQRFTFVFDLPQLAGKTFGTNNNDYLWARIFQLSGTTTNTSIDIWGVQLEAAPAASAFFRAHANTATELSACQRYYYRETAGSGGAAYLNMRGSTPTTTTARFWFPLPTTMRTTPTAVDTSALGASGTIQIGNQATLATLVAATSVTAVSLPANYSTPSQAVVEFTVSSVTVSTPCYIAALASGYVGVSAEL